MKVRPTAAMTDIIVKIMVEVISILGIVTKEIRQGLTSTLFLTYRSSRLDPQHREVFQEALGNERHRGRTTAIR